MSSSVSLYTVIAVLVGALAAIVLIVRPILRGRPAIGWLALGLVSGMPAVVLYGEGGDSPLTMAILAIFDVLSVTCVCFAIRAAVDAPPVPKRLAATAAALLATSLALIGARIGWPFLAAVPFQLGTMLMLASAVHASARGIRSVAQGAMFAGIALNLAAFVLRLPFWPSLMDAGRAYPSIASPWLNTAMLALSSLFVPMVVLGILGCEIGWLVGNYRDRSERDGLTGLNHRLSFETRVAEAPAKVGVLVIADIDHFKAINDRYGHAVGDRVIVAFARFVAEARGIAARVGGEEFALAMPGASIQQGEAEAEAIRRRFHALRPRGVDPDHFLSASFGVADYRAGEPFNRVFARADAALYDAKARGRNKTVVRVGEADGERRDEAVSYSSTE
jgi:diguanylate cyclase (GGDEF)-like protein